jgi:O-antigen biosynthesis alpha-1,3-abequosyltransferase
MSPMMKLLTIAIPTFNRAHYLDLCLSHLSRQLPGNEQLVDLLVSDNNSTDDTGLIVRKYLEQGLCITYKKNCENIGAARNVLQCYTLATGKYVLVLGDDDFLLAGALSEILRVLQRGEFGVVHLGVYSYHDETALAALRQNRSPGEEVIFSDKKKFIRKVHYYLTFISGNVVNRTLLFDNLDLDEFAETNLPQLSWTVSALFSAAQNVVLDRYLVAAKLENSGGYKPCETFGYRMNTIFEVFIKKGVKKEYFDIIRRNLLFSFFPYTIMKRRRNRGSFLPENCFATLYPIFRTYPVFWLVTVPAMYLPLPVVELGSSFMRKTIRLLGKLKR